MELDRRALIVSAAGLMLSDAIATPGVAASPAPGNPLKGKPGDFDFLAGSWKIHNRRPKAGSKTEWDEFPGEATCWTVLDGVGSIEELRIPARKFSGLGIRLLDVEKRVWSDFFVNARSGVLACPGQTGGFHEGAGIFSAEDVHEGRPLHIRGIWDRITKTTCRWQQATSIEGGKTWVTDWVMGWTRV